MQKIQNNLNCKQIHLPIGVCAGITSKHYPVMVPLSIFPLAITAGNTFVLKPSEKVSGVTNILARIMKKIKLPNGVFNIV